MRETTFLLNRAPYLSAALLLIFLLHFTGIQPQVKPEQLTWREPKVVAVEQSKVLTPVKLSVAEQSVPPVPILPLPLLPPTVSFKVPPAYPAAALKEGIEGTVMVAAYVIGIGRPAKVELQSSSGNELLDQAALQAVAEWEFLPATQGGAGLASYLDIPVVFQII